MPDLSRHAGTRTRYIGRAGALPLALLLVLTGCAGDDAEPVTVGLITKQEANPFWVTMREVAQDVADEHGVELLTATGQSDVDVEAQVEALRDMVERGVQGVLIAPTDSAAVVPAIDEARAAGVVVIAVDTPTDPSRPSTPCSRRTTGEQAS
jgi:fructose transport system substrate-binding protein